MDETRDTASEAQKPAQPQTRDERTLLLAELIEEARENRRIGWDEDRGDQYARHWGGVIGWLRHKLPAGHPLAFRRPAPAEDAEACPDCCRTAS